MKILALGGVSKTLFPFSLIIGIIILTISGYILTKILGFKDKILLFVGALLLPLCPFILQMLWYKFDVLSMCLSFFFAIVPFVFYRRNNYFLIASFISLFLVFGLYQSTAFSYCIILCFLLVKDLWKSNFQNIWKKTIVGILAFLGGFLLYKLPFIFFDKTIYLGKGVAGKGTYVGTFIFSFPNPKQLFLDRFSEFLKLYNDLLQSVHYKHFLLFVVMVCLFVSIRFLYKERMQKYFIIKLLLTLILLGFIAVFAIGINLFVIGYGLQAKPWFGRYFLGYGVATYGLFILAIQLSKNKIVGIISFIPMLYFSFLLSSQTGLFIKNQEEYYDFVISQITPELNKHNNLRLIIDDNIKPLAPYNKTITIKTFPFIHRLALMECNGNWLMARFNKFKSFRRIKGKKKIKVLKSKDKMPIVIKNKTFQLRVKDNVAILSFR